MIDPYDGYAVSRIGNWPKEQYQITFNYFNTVKRNVTPSKLPASNLFRYIKNPKTNIDSILYLYNIPQISFSNCFFNLETSTGMYILSSNNFSSSTYTWSPSTLRTADCGNIFNYFQLEERYAIINTLDVDFNIKNSYAYFILPTRLFLKPTNISYNQILNKYTLTTEAILLSSSIKYYREFDTANSAFFDLEDTLKKNPTTFEPLPSTGSLIYSLSSYRYKKDLPIINFSESHNPIGYIDRLDEFLNVQDIFIRPESVFVTYDSDFFNYDTNPISIIRIGQFVPESVFKLKNYFDTSFILNQDIKNSKNFQTFQLVQSSKNAALSLEDFSNAIQHFNLTLSTGLIDYKIDTTLVNSISTPSVSGAKDTSLTISYAAESNLFFNNTIAVDPITTPVVSNPNANPTRTWTLNYPPHYYSFKVKYDNGSDFIGDTSILNFNLSSCVTQMFPSKFQQPNSSTISYSGFQIYTKLVSDYNYMSLNLTDYAKNDLIRFSASNIDDFFIPYLSCLYGPNFAYTYSLTDSPFISAVSAQEIKILYPKELWGELNVLLKCELKNDSLGVNIDSSEYLDLIFSENKSFTNVGYPINIELISEKENSITISCAKLSTTEVLPSRDLRDSDIRWSFSPPDANVIIMGVDYNDITTPTLSAPPGPSQPLTPCVFQNGQLLPFNNLTSTVTISNYGQKQLTIVLESLKYEESTQIKTDPLLFDFFKDNTFSLSASPVVNVGRTANFTISSKVVYENYLFDIPNLVPVYWTWSLNDNPTATTLRVSAYRLNGTPYKTGDILNAEDINVLNFSLDLEDNDNAFDTNKLTISMKSNYKDRLVVGSLDIFINDFPDPSIFNVDFSTQYFAHQNFEISNTRKNQTVLTRPKGDINTFYFKSNTDVLPKIIADSITWFISNDTGMTSSVDYFTNQNIAYTIETAATATNIILSATKAYIQGWPIKNNIFSQLTIYVLPNNEFYKPFEFIIYPPYTWLQNSNGNITLLNETNYTLSKAPTAYYGKLSNSQDFYVSGNKTFSEYDYCYGPNKILIDTLVDRKGSIDIPYHQEFSSSTGTTISVSAFNNFYPRSNGISYTGLNINNNLYLGYFTNTTNTIPFSSTNLNTVSSFKQSPKLVPYDEIELNFTPKTTSIDLDNNVFVTVSQTITPVNSSTSPIRGSQEFLNGSITYILSCKYWEVPIDVSTIDGTYDLCILRVGDPATPLYIKDSEITTLVLKASGISPAYIPSTTFQNQPESYELWAKINQDILSTDQYTIYAYSTSVKPKIFVSSYYAITGESLFFQFETPENTFNYKVTSYLVSFGDGTSSLVFDDNIYFKSYDKLGAFNWTYRVNYSGGNVTNFKLDIPIFVYPSWQRYDQSKIRLLNEVNLEFNGKDDTYTLEQIEIQPNEWGDADIFNTAIERLHANFEYLVYNAQTLNTDTPTLFYGWLGTNSENKADGIKWHTVSYNKEQVNSFENITDLSNDTLEVQSKFSHFNDIRDSKEIQNRLYVLDGTVFRAFSASKTPTEINFENKKEIDALLINPVSIDTDETGENVYISDVFRNKVYKLNVDFDVYPAQINLQLSVGNLGVRTDINKFNSPSEIVYENENLFVLDYNNRCVKQYTKDLNWMFTYYVDEFENEQPINVAIHPETLLVYILTEKYNIYIFEYFKTEIFETIDISFIKNTNSINKMFFDKFGDFIYFIDSNNIFKYSSSGMFINKLNIPQEDLVQYVSGKHGDFQSLIINTKSAIIKMQDVLNIFKIGDGLNYDTWSVDQLKVNRDEFPDDITYNRSLNRLAQNLKAFRGILDSRFVIVTEKTDYGTVQYFSLYPVSYQNRPKFTDDIENEKLGVGVNEFHIPQVFNREFKKLYNNLLILLDFLNLKDVRLLANTNVIDELDTGCQGIFCWSWKAMSCYNLSLPIIRICNINPITYEELENRFPSEYVYAPSNKYGDAVSNCCDDAELPI